MHCHKNIKFGYVLKNIHYYEFIYVFHMHVVSHEEKIKIKMYNDVINDLKSCKKYFQKLLYFLM